VWLKGQRLPASPKLPSTCVRLRPRLQQCILSASVAAFQFTFVGVALCFLSRRVAAVSTEASLVMTKAAEHFIGWVTKKAIANKDLRERKKVCLNYHDLPPLVAQNPDQLEFAGDL
jgi:hypothetical protein